MNLQRLADIVTVVKAAGAVVALILIPVIIVVVVVFAYIMGIISWQMLVDIGHLVTAIGAVIAVGIALYVYCMNKKWNTYRYLADLYYEILRRGLEHPKFLNPEYTREYKKTWPSGSETERYFQYGAYAKMCWTHAFDILDTKELKKDFISLYLPTIDGYNKLHGVWLLDHTSTFSFDFIDFVLSYKWREREYLGKYAAGWVRWENVVDDFDGKILNPFLKTDGKRLSDYIKDDGDIKEYLKKKDKVVVADFGCGNGKLIKELSEIKKEKIENVYGIDFPDNMLEMAKKRCNLTNVTFEKIDMTNLSEISGDIDIAFSINSILPRNPNDIPIILDEIYNALKPGGLFIAILPSFDTVLYLKELWYKHNIENKKRSKWKAERKAKWKVMQEFHKHHKLNVGYLFSWDNVPENDNDNERLKKFLRYKFDFDWAENAEIRKPDAMTINISANENSVEIRMDEKKEKATLKISDDRTHDLKVKSENGKLNIYTVRKCLDAEDFLNVYHYIYGKEIHPLLEKAGFELKQEEMEKVTYPPCKLCEDYDYDYFSEEDFWDWLVVAKKPRNGE
jgi:ubiquinone/menaquinone biosynthesis C-methylase UbiE